MRRPALLMLLTASACSGGPPAPSSPTPEPARSGQADRPRTFQPGAPGQAARPVDARELTAAAGVAHSEADVRFMRGMIPHHAQALEMTALVPERTPDRGFRQLALRIEISQRDEIALMERWLEARGESPPASHAGHAGSGEMGLMPGMLTPEQMARLEAASGAEFERLFLELMIQHHEGAIVMVADLFAAPGGGQESEIFQFASHVDADQRMEIERMRRMLEARRQDP